MLFDIRNDAVLAQQLRQLERPVDTLGAQARRAAECGSRERVHLRAHLRSGEDAHSATLTARAPCRLEDPYTQRYLWAELFV